MIEFERVHRRHANGQFALEDVSFSLAAGQMAFVTGHSGAGKSTLLKLIPRLDRPTSGRIRVGGIEISRLSRRRIPMLRRQIGVVFQEHHLLSDRRVFDNVALPLRVSAYPHDDIARRVRAALDKVGLLDRERAYPQELSGGEQQRVNIARALVNRPRILLADEPTGNLDPELSLQIYRQFMQFNDVGVTVLIASHELALLRTFDVPRLVLRAGRLEHIEKGE
ncbi:MAG: cell division ATP-binding protein FtsE [Halothiobacillaceae bacterium]